MNLSDFIQTRQLLLLDGAMGTQLEKRDAKAGISNLTKPDAVLQVHREYVESGSRALIANTFGMNRIYIETHGLEVDVEAVNEAGAKLAKEASEGRLYVLGNLSSTGQMLQPYGTYKETDFYATFKEQADILAGNGVDGFIIETMFDLQEALCALNACKDAAPIPVFVSMSFSTAEKGGRTIMGNQAEQIARELADAGADGLGANCGDLSPEEIAQVVSYMKPVVTTPLIAEPNAGKPKLIGGKTVFDMDPDTFAAGIVRCVEAGATIVGGCCGTTPDHIRTIAAALGIEKQG